MARNPEKRAASRERDKLRKRERRALKALQKQAKNATTDFERKTYMTRMAQIQRNIKGLSFNRASGTYNDDNIVDKLRKDPTSVAKATRKASYAEESRKAARGESSGLSYSGEAGRFLNKAFYFSTQQFWENRDPFKRNDYITEEVNKMRAAKGLKQLTFEEIYADIINSEDVQKALKMYMDRNNSSVYNDTDDLQEGYYEAANQSGQESGMNDSPEVLAFVDTGIQRFIAYGA